MKENLSRIIKPEWDRKKVLRCKQCEKIFAAMKICLITKCPQCGSRNIEADKHVRY
jgi:predicted Zn-ribbon and HTH transcriptional regulator